MWIWFRKNLIKSFTKEIFNENFIFWTVPFSGSSYCFLKNRKFQVLEPTTEMILYFSYLILWSSSLKVHLRRIENLPKCLDSFKNYTLKMSHS